MARPKATPVDLTVRRRGDHVVKMTVTGYALPVVGLVATRPLITDTNYPDNCRQASNGWLITHAGTGYKVNGRRAKTLADAAAIALDLKELGLDWTLDGDAVLTTAVANDPGRWPHTVKIIETVGNIFWAPPCGVRTMGRLGRM